MATERRNAAHTQREENSFGFLRWAWKGGVRSRRMANIKGTGLLELLLDVMGTGLALRPVETRLSTAREG